MDRLFRYMSFEQFVDMVQNQALTLVRPALWDDNYEYYIVEQLSKKIIDKRIKNVYIEAFTYSLYAQSWTKLNESDAMWRIYGKNSNTIKIAVKRNKIEELNLLIKEIEYTDELDKRVEDFEKFQFVDMLSIKRKAFEHEQEVRIIASLGVQNILSELRSLNGYKQLIKKINIDESNEVNDIQKMYQERNENIDFLKKQNVLHIAFSNIEEFLDEVVIHPMAESWFVDMVRKYSIQNGIKEFRIKKSMLYTK